MGRWEIDKNLEGDFRGLYQYYLDFHWPLSALDAIFMQEQLSYTINNSCVTKYVMYNVFF
jgi:hypothetical protein